MSVTEFQVKSACRHKVTSRRRLRAATADSILNSRSESLQKHFRCKRSD
jgi:hypothetical protein